MKHDADAKTYAEAVAAAIRRRREAADLSMNRLGEAAGLSQPMVGLIERAVHTPTISTLFRIARALGTTPAAMLAEIESAPVSAGAAPRSKAGPATTTRRKVPAGTSRLKKRPKPL